MKKFSIIGMLLISFILESCSYSSPKEAYDVNITGKNALQKTNATTSRRSPAGNKSFEETRTESSQQVNLKKNNNNYDAYQHYQAAKPPKKSKRRPILNLKELNDLMDREATITLTERRSKNGEQPKVDADSNIQEVIEYNKSKKKSNSKPKKRVKVLVVKKDEPSAPEKIITPSDTPVVEKVKTVKTSTLPAAKAPIKKATKATTTKSQAQETQKLPEPTITVPAVASSNNLTIVNPETKPVSTSTPDVPATAEVPAASVLSSNVSTEVIKTPEESSAVAPTLDITPPTNTSLTTAAMNQDAEAEIPADNSLTNTEMSPVDLTTDTSGMTQQELEQHLKEKFNNNGLDSNMLDNTAIDSQIDEIDTSSNLSTPEPIIPLPAIPNATASNFSSGLNRLNELFITCYYKVKLSIMSLVSSWFGLDW